MDFSKKLSFDFLSLLKICLFLIGVGCMLGIYSNAIAWIVIIASAFLAINEAWTIYYSYKAKAKEKKS